MHLFFQQYLERYGRLNASASAVKNMTRTAVLFEESGLDPTTAEDWQIEEWLAGLPLKPRTKRLHLENLSASYNYAVKRGQMKLSPTETVRLPREPDKEPKILEAAELRQLLRNAFTHTQTLMLHTLIYTGMRRNEVRNLKWEDISADTITVVGKAGKLRHVPLHPALAETILASPEPHSPYLFSPYGNRGCYSEFAMQYQLKKAAGGIECSFHDFRRTVATSLAENEVPEGIIDRIMGWAPRTVGRRYYIRRADSRMQEAILKLYADDPITA